MFIRIQFKNKDLKFIGKLYDYKLTDDVAPPPVGSIIRMEYDDGTAAAHHTRVKVVDVIDSSDKAYGRSVCYTMAAL